LWKQCRIEAEQKPAAAPVPAPTKAAAPVAQSAPQPSKPLGPSKVMASAAVRLFKINQSSRAYEPVDNGSMLGCAILGTGLNFQILVYNAQVGRSTLSVDGLQLTWVAGGVESTTSSSDHFQCL
jgi:hypothetical protein